MIMTIAVHSRICGYSRSLDDEEKTSIGSSTGESSALYFQYISSVKDNQKAQPHRQIAELFNGRMQF